MKSDSSRRSPTWEARERTPRALDLRVDARLAAGFLAGDFLVVTFLVVGFFVAMHTVYTACANFVFYLQ